MSAASETELLETAVRAALIARDHLRERASRGVVSSREHDIKLVADLEGDRLLVEFLRSQTGIPILSEEGGWTSGGESLLETGSCWIVDPLDGSFNFDRGIPLAAVSIGLWKNGSPVLGVVSDIFRDDVFSGSISEGLTVNGTSANVSSVTEMKNAVLCTGLPVAGSFDVESLTKWASELGSYKKVRYLGSAALSLAYVASGRADVYKERGIRIWDVAGGLALVMAGAGASNVTRMSSPTTLDVSASNGRVRAS
ncbi:MAG: inositol monophosphatase family protein [Bdellovibrionota bacterium]